MKSIFNILKNGNEPETTNGSLQDDTKRKYISSPFRTITLILLAISGLLVIVISISAFIINLWGGFETPRQDMIENFKENSDNFYRTIDFVKSIDPEAKAKEIYFRDIKDPHSVNINGQYINLELVDIKSWPNIDTLIASTPWNRTSILELRKKLNAIKCDGIINDTTFVFTNGNCYYHLFQYPVNKTNFSDSCRYYFYNEKVVFEYVVGKFDVGCWNGEVRSY